MVGLLKFGFGTTPFYGSLCQESYTPSIERIRRRGAVHIAIALKLRKGKITI
jgi:hypothetical protein